MTTFFFLIITTIKKAVYENKPYRFLQKYKQDLQNKRKRKKEKKKQGLESFKHKILCTIKSTAYYPSFKGFVPEQADTDRLLCNWELILFVLIVSCALLTGS